MTEQVTHALTEIQPWGTAIIHLGKDVENRSWGPPWSFVGKRIAIHAGAKLDKDSYADLVVNVAGEFEVPKSAIVGTVELAGFVDVERNALHGNLGACTRALLSPWRNPDTRFLWCMRNPRAFATPIPCKGALGLWRIPSELLEAVNHG